jgi:hypothetical protein
MNIYRTYHNVQLGANAQIHTVLLALEKILKEEGRIPDITYIQIDGGSENISKVVMAMCELLVASGVTKKIVLSRLMVGHTHEDIDSKFALIWRRIRSAFALTMSHYKKAVESCLSYDGLTSEVIDMFAIPDYDKLLRPLVDKNFGRYAKRVGSNDWSVLEFTVEGIDDAKLLKFFPNGVKTLYRPYCADKVLRIVKDDEAPLRMTVDELGPITSFPPADPERGLPEGMCILNELPDSVPEAEQFVVGSHELLQNVSSKMLHKFSSDASRAIHDEWKHFRDHIAPQSDLVEEYIKKVPLHIPLRKELFERRARVADVMESRKIELQREYGERSRKSIPLDYVQSSLRRKKPGDPALLHPSMIVDGPSGEVYSEPVYCPEPHHINRNKKKSAPPPVADEVSRVIAVEDAASVASSNSEDATDSDVEDDMGYVTCRTPRALPHNYGDPLGFVGWKFEVIPKYAHKADYAKTCSDGIVAAVVRPRGCGDDDTKLLFKCYNYVTLSSEPSVGSSDWVYVPCAQFLSCSVKRRMMNWVREQTTPTKKQPTRPDKKQTWEYTTKPADGLYDTYDKSTLLSDEDMNAGPRTRNQRQQQNKRIVSSRMPAVVVSSEADSCHEDIDAPTFPPQRKRQRTIPNKSNPPESSDDILLHHQQLKDAVHNRVRKKVAKVRARAAEQEKGKFVSDRTYNKQKCGYLRDSIPLITIAEESKCNSTEPFFQDDNNVLLSDLSCSDESDTDSDDSSNSIN